MKLGVVFSLLLTCAVLSGCSVAMSANRSAYKGDPSVIHVGAERGVIESALGPPNLTADISEGKTKVIYALDLNAHKKLTRNAAVVGHVAADILTFGLWEIAGTPLEVSAQSKFTNYIIIYGSDNKVQSLEVVEPKPAIKP